MNGILSCGFMAATGARVGGAPIKAEHIKVGYLDLYNAGWKIPTAIHPKEPTNKPGNKWLKNQRPDIWLYLPEPFRAAHYSWNCFPTPRKIQE